MSSPSKPTVVIVPGAFHVPRNYHALTSALESHGFKVHGVELPSSAEHPTTTSFKPDAAAVHSVVSPLVDNGEEVLLIMHSMGGVYGSEGIKGLLKPEREAQHLKGGVTSLFYMCAILAPEGSILVQMTPSGKPPDNITFDPAHPNTALLVPEKIDERFYHDVPAHLVAEQKALLKNSSIGAMMSPDTPTEFAPWKVEGVKATYLFCELDLALPVPGQEMVLGLAGGGIEVVKCRSGHMPWLSMPEATLQAVRRAAGEDV